jgi:hypothetical protein
MTPRSPVRSRTLLAWLAVSVVAHGVGVRVALRGPGSHRALTADDLTKHPASPQVGETFEVPIEELDRGGAPPSDETSPEPTAVPSDGPSERARPESRPGHSVTSASPSGPGGSETLSFGAVGDRSAIEITTAFTRGFPQAASTDPLWVSAPFGPAGSADVTLIVDETGALVDTRVTGAPSAALAAGVRRTLALIRARSFIAAGRETHLRITASVTPDEVHDGLHGDVFAIGAPPVDHGEGTGFFALSVGRRVDVKVREVR